MTRASKREIDWPDLTANPADVTRLGYVELTSLHQEGIMRELAITRVMMTKAMRDRSRVPAKLSAISNNTNSALAFEKGAALAEFLEERDLTELYMSAPPVSVSGGESDWAARFDNPSGSGYFTVSYTEGYLEGSMTHTQKLSYTGRV